MGTLYLDGVPHESMVLDGYCTAPRPTEPKVDRALIEARWADIFAEFRAKLTPLVKQCEVARTEGTKPFHRKQRDQAA